MISREIAENLARKASYDADTLASILSAGGLDIAACEAAGLAHDLGHPPFGHAGESELNRLLRDRKVTEGFEGNAQSFRIVEVLDRHNYEAGLQLTNVVRAAILKYPWCRDLKNDKGESDEQQKFSSYASEELQFKEARAALGFEHSTPTTKKRAEQKQAPQSLEASVMDLADDIAYSIHDLEDFCSQGFIDLSSAVDQLELYVVRRDMEDNPFVEGAAKLAKYHPELFNADEYKAAARRASSLLDIVNSPSKSQSARDEQLRGDLSVKIAEFFDSITISEEHGAPSVSLLSPQWHDMQVLKLVTKRYLVSTARMGQIQRAQRKTVERLFVGLEEWVRTAKELSALPETLRVFMGTLPVGIPDGKPLSDGHYRAIVDYICTMSDSEAFLRAQWVTGTEIPGMANLGLVE